MKRILAITVAITALLLLFGCSAGVDFDKLTIVAEDAFNVAEGDYTLRYTVPDYDKYNAKYNLSVQVNVYDKSEKSVAVANNRSFAVKADEEYTVTVIVSAVVDDRTKTKIKSYKVIAAKKDLTVAFYLYNTSTLYKKLTVPYGTTLDINDYAKIPDTFTESTSDTGVKQIILSKEWQILEDNKVYRLTQEDLRDIKRNLTIIAHYEYQLVYSDITIAFDNGEGATETESITQLAHSLIKKPSFPTKEGYVFCGWYYDKEYKKVFSWADTYRVQTDTTLYAKWVPAADEHAEYFEYTLEEDDDGYPYYLCNLNRKTDFPKEITVPAGYDNIPVRGFCLADVGSMFQLGAFEDTDVVAVTVPETFRYRSVGAFTDCKQLTSVTINSDELTIIGMEAFKNCTALKKIVIPSGVREIYRNAFEGCTALTDVTLPDTLTNINNYLFKGCTSLAEIKIPDSVIEIYTGAFEGCTALTRVEIGENSQLDFITKGAFRGCENLKEITLPYCFKGQISTPEIFVGQEITVSYHPSLKEEE